MLRMDMGEGRVGVVHNANVVDTPLPIPPPQGGRGKW